MVGQSVSERIACIGGMTVDRQVRPVGRLRGGTSNPVRSISTAGGAARNVAETLARLGCDVTLFSRVGEDDAGSELLRAVARVGIDASGVDRSPTHPTASYTAVLDERGELSIGLADTAIFDELEPGWSDRIAARLVDHRLWVLDANLPADVLGRLLEEERSGRTVAADPVSVDKAKRLEGVLGRIDLLFPDRAEAAALSGTPTHSPDGVAAAAARLREAGVGTVVVSLGADGLWIDDGGRQEHVPALPVRSIGNVSGAGDALIAGYLWAVLAGEGTDPVAGGLAAASLALESDRTVTEGLTAERLRGRLETRISR